MGILDGLLSITGLYSDIFPPLDPITSGALEHIVNLVHNLGVTIPRIRETRRLVYFDVYEIRILLSWTLFF